MTDDAPVLISLNAACERTSLSRTRINTFREQGIFPAAVPLGERRIAFVKSEVDRWIADRIARRDHASAAG